MSDLRDRIAAVIARHRMDRSNYEMADAVIAELGLHREVEIAQAGIRIRATAHRYVTDWEPDRQPRSAEKLGLTGDGT